MRSYLRYPLMIILYTIWVCQGFKILTLIWTSSIKSEYKSLAKVVNSQTLKWKTKNPKNENVLNTEVSQRCYRPTQMPSTNNMTTKKGPDQLISTPLPYNAPVGCCTRLFQRRETNHSQQPRPSTNDLNKINMFICLSVFFKKAAAAALYTQRWKFAMSGGGCPSLVPQKQTWDNKSGHAVIWELQGTPAGEGAVRGGGCWDTYPMGREAQVHGETLGSREHMPWNKPIQPDVGKGACVFVHLLRSWLSPAPRPC